MKSEREVELLTRIAWLYYYSNMTQQEIADFLHLSRIKVARSLKAAQKIGIVEINIRSSNISLFSFEEKLRNLSGLRYIIVVPSSNDNSDSICRGTAHLFNDILDYKGSLGIGLSRTLKNISKYIKKEKNDFSSVVSICGTANPNLAMTPLNIGFSIAETLSVDFYSIWAPVIVSNENDCKIIKRDKFISSVLKMAENVDIALVGIGSVDDSQLMDVGYISKEEHDCIVKSGAVGEIIGNYFNLKGELIETSLSNRLISVSFPMKCPVIAAAGGLNKVNSIVGAIRSGLIQGLVIDEETAKGVIRKLEKSG